MNCLVSLAESTELNLTIRIISFIVKSTPRQWVPVLCEIEPPEIRIMGASLREYTKAIHSTTTPGLC